MTPIPGEKMNLLNLIRANREPSLLTGTTKEFVTGSETNLIPWTTHLTCENLPYWILYRPRKCVDGKIHNGNWGIRTQLHQWNGIMLLSLHYCDTKTLALSAYQQVNRHSSSILDRGLQQYNLTPRSLKGKLSFRKAYYWLTANVIRAFFLPHSANMQLLLSNDKRNFQSCPRFLQTYRL